MNMPIIKIELESMKHTVCHAMTEHLSEMDEGIQEAVKVAVDNFDYRGEISRIANAQIKQALEEAIRRHFQYGGDGYEEINKVATSLIEKRLAEQVR